MRDLIITVFTGIFVCTSSWAADLKSNPEIASLYDKAKAEGQVTIWGPSRGEVEWIPSAFAQAFPGIQVRFSGDNDVVTKAIAEARGGRSELDVMWNSVTASAPLIQRDLVSKLSLLPFGSGPEGLTYDDRLGFTNKVAYAVVYMASKHKPEDLPKRWDDVLADKYRDRMVSNLFLLPRLLGGLSLDWGLERTMRFARDLLGKSNLMLTKAPRESLIESGERDFAYGEIDTGYRRQIRDGKAFGIALPEPVVLVQFGVTVMTKAPHPNAARLLAGWLVSEEGRQARRNATGQLDYEQNSNDPIAKGLHSGQVKAIYDLPSNMAQREEAIRKLGPIVAGQGQ